MPLIVVILNPYSSLCKIPLPLYPRFCLFENFTPAFGPRE